MTHNEEKGEKTKGAKRDERDGFPALIAPFPRLAHNHGGEATLLVPASSRNAARASFARSATFSSPGAPGSGSTCRGVPV